MPITGERVANGDITSADASTAYAEMLATGNTWVSAPGSAERDKGKSNAYRERVSMMCDIYLESTDSNVVSKKSLANWAKRMSSEYARKRDKFPFQNLEGRNGTRGEALGFQAIVNAVLPEIADRHSQGKLPANKSYEINS
jgi:hypothetical protein